MDYLEKITKKPSDDLFWNIPEQKQGIVNVIGGNSQSFRTPLKATEFLLSQYPIKTANLVLPDSLKDKLPPLPNLVFLSSTDSGSFSSEDELKNVMNAADFNLIIGDLSKNNITGAAFLGSCLKMEKPILITRDAVDLIAEKVTEELLLNEKIIFLATMPQLIKLFRTVYYPKMLILSMPLVQVAEVLHKFTLSYPAQIITTKDDQVLIAKNGKVKIVPLEKTNFTPLSFWIFEAAAKILALNLYNPNNFLDATVSAIFE